MIRSSLLLLLVTSPLVARADASTLCFDDPADVIGVGGASCCLSGLLDAEVSAACGDRTYSCTFESTCALTMKGDSGVRIVDGSMAVAPPSQALLWAPHRCCIDSSVAIRDPRDVTVWSPQPLVCELRPGCRVELEYAPKYATDVPPELAVATMPWSERAWEMFLVCAADGSLGVAACAEEWLLPRCGAAICGPEYRDRLVSWLDKVTAARRGPTSVLTPPDEKAPLATLFTSEAAACCIAGTERTGAYLVGGLLRVTACDYDATCTPAEGDVLFYGEEDLLVAKGNAWTQLPSTCQAEVDALGAALALLEGRLAQSEAGARDVRDQLQDELRACAEDLHDLKQQGGGACSPPPQPPIVTTDDVLQVTGEVATVWLLENDVHGDAEVAAVSPPARGLAIWQPDGRLTYYPDPGFHGADTIFYRVVDAAGNAATGALEVRVE